MKRVALLSAVLLALPAFAIPSGKKWFLDTCTNNGQACATLNGGQANGNRICTAGRCLPEVRFAASIDNTGGNRLNGQQQIPYSTLLTIMRRSFDRWSFTNAQCSPSIAFAFAATPFTSPSGVTAVNGLDDQNNVIWLTGNAWRYSTATLGLTTNTFYPGELSDSDTEMNNNVTWGEGATISSGDYDAESVLTHEAGHFIGFDHTPTTIAVMLATISTGEIKRNLAGPDISDVCTIYPPSSTATGSFGSTCTGNTCTSPLVCEGVAGSTTRTCTNDCSNASQTCPIGGFSCQASTNGFACLPQVGAPDQCKFCTSGQDCSTGICLTDGTGRNWCSLGCNPSVSGQCGPGYQCQSTTAGNFCSPTTTCPNQCTTTNVATTCAPGYGCVGGTCTPTGNPGDRCEVAEFCQNCGACAVDEVDPAIAFCRACCNGGAPFCQGCTATSCQPIGTTATQCLPITGRNESLCYPSSGGTTCATCNGSMPCQAGSVCFGGLCRASCNPASPAGCAACQTTPSGGVCACSATEISNINQPCSGTGSTLAICRTGLSCVAGFCRQLCDTNNPATCQTDSTCQLVGSQQVCIPGTSGQRCATCGAGGQCEPGLICYSNRCYPPCSTSLANQCSTCVQVDPDPPAGSGAGICACADQVVGAGASCLLPNIATCQAGTRCISGICSPRCDLNDPTTCNNGRVCRAVAGQGYCVEDTSGEAGGTAQAGGTAPTAGGRGGGSTFTGTGGGRAGGAGGGGTTVTNMGCGCTSFSGLWPVVPLALAVLSRRRRRE